MSFKIPDNVYRLNDTLSPHFFGNNESIFRTSISHFSAITKNICNEIHEDKGQTLWPSFTKRSGLPVFA